MLRRALLPFSIAGLLLIGLHVDFALALTEQPCAGDPNALPITTEVGSCCSATWCDTENACIECGGRCCPTGWIVNADILFLRRSSPHDVLLVSDQITGAPVLSADAINFDHEATPYLQLMRPRSSGCNPCVDCCWDWDIGYMGVTSWNDSVVANPPNSPVLHAPGVDLPSSAPGNRFQFRNGTDLHSVEFNLRRHAGECLTWLVGYRWLGLSDRFDVDEVGNGFASVYRVNADNHLHGFQTGLDAVLWNNGGAVRIDGLLRAGIFLNQADYDMDAPPLARFAPIFADHAGAATDHTSFLGHVGITGQYDLRGGWSIRGGYHVMWLEGVALAADQIATTSLVAPPSVDVATGGSLLFHGASVGLQARW